MIQIQIGNNVNRKTIVVPETKTVKEIIDENSDVFEPDMRFRLNGTTLSGADVNRPISDFDYQGGSYTLTQVVNKDNATDDDLDDFDDEDEEEEEEDDGFDDEDEEE